MRRSDQIGSSAVVVLVIAAALAVVAVPLILSRQTPQAPEGTPPPGVRAVAGELHTIPDIDPAGKAELATEIGRVLEALYGQAFFGLRPEPTLPPDPQVTPATAVDAFFTGSAREALRRSPEVFRPVAPLQLVTGRVGFGGVATLEGANRHVLLEIDFDAAGSLNGPTTPEVRLRQRGTLWLVEMPYGWRVGGFELDFVSKPAETEEPR